MTLAELYTADFVKIFEDTADLIIGWLVDPTSYQSDQESYNQLVDQMIQLRPFWVASLKDSGTVFDQQKSQDYKEPCLDSRQNFVQKMRIIEVERFAKKYRGKIFII